MSIFILFISIFLILIQIKLNWLIADPCKTQRFVSTEDTVCYAVKRAYKLKPSQNLYKKLLTEKVILIMLK
ncbi:hypothetical protein DSCO28_17100 [Desulfosarcina ovata subsp. sediminis]|uniref:Uncharacterized protein n=1 Tax=Desulfosarcina ovata subsp. sediminis TaxID=885957 RepID=A0A5K7ZID4_9BACT|nr:hypothetical protein DSCO28_17100 [Desulfosarcina ovata subsp. sediminis]